MVIAELGDDRRQRELLEGGHFGRDGAECGPDASLFTEHVDAKTAAFGGHIGEIQVAAAGKVLRLRAVRTSAM